MQKNIVNVALAFLMIGALVAGVVGWIWNIVKLMEMSLDPLTGLLAVRVVGIFLAPIGAIVGYF